MEYKIGDIYTFKLKPLEQIRNEYQRNEIIFGWADSMDEYAGKVYDFKFIRMQDESPMFIKHPESDSWKYSLSMFDLDYTENKTMKTLMNL